ncbi:hypothetical protein CN072_27355 [Sinorhizobium meliloti]|uniref:hypothetical protein n=1 Tax=Rhizobium meliloti TaxID=382 RepID=UPI000FD1F919|nr:hypothetical protein [Sinorhizobium meliloti]RVP80658.1 hypothetical protein CN072_27355 [Sinorhizobium meliloti]
MTTIELKGVLDEIEDATEASLRAAQYVARVHPAPATKPPTPERCRQREAYHRLMSEWYRAKAGA